MTRRRSLPFTITSPEQVTTVRVHHLVILAGHRGEVTKQSVQEHVGRCVNKKPNTSDRLRSIGRPTTKAGRKTGQGDWVTSMGKRASLHTKKPDWSLPSCRCVMYEYTEGHTLTCQTEILFITPTSRWLINRTERTSLDSLGQPPEFRGGIRLAQYLGPQPKETRQIRMAL